MLPEERVVVEGVESYSVGSGEVSGLAWHWVGFWVWLTASLDLVVISSALSRRCEG